MKEAPVAPLEGDFIFASRRLVMYGDLNSAGRLFGGELMRWVDEGVAQVAARIMQTKSLVTKRFGEVVFDYPGRLGDSVEMWCRVEKKGTTSLTMEVRVVVRGVCPETLHQICHLNIVYVALDGDGRPVPWRKAPC